MTAPLDAFTASVAAAAPPPGLSAPLAALWWTARGDWDRAHALVQDDAGRDAACVHAHLHRREGDEANARYWYRRAGRAPADGPLDAEWADLAATLLAADGRGAPDARPVNGHRREFRNRGEPS